MMPEQLCFRTVCLVQVWFSRGHKHQVGHRPHFHSSSPGRYVCFMEMFEIGQEPPMPKETLYDVHEELSLLFTLAKRQAFANNTSIAACLETWPILAPCFSGFSRVLACIEACRCSRAVMLNPHSVCRRGKFLSEGGEMCICTRRTDSRLQRCSDGQTPPS